MGASVKTLGRLLLRQPGQARPGQLHSSLHQPYFLLDTGRLELGILLYQPPK